MNIVDIIVKKKDKKILSKSEIRYVIDNYMNGNIKDYQMSSLLMAIVLNGMNNEEIFELTRCMLNSGDKLDLSGIPSVVDKHSTGGVGDKTTLIVGAIAASCGCHVAKMSGPGLGHTGGTIDKLESIPGFNSSLSEDEFIKIVREVGFSDIRPTNNMVPADKKIYGLRDVTGTVSSIPLIASSIMSKKIASGSKNLVIDVKVGSGALVNDIDDARKLARIMIDIGKDNGMSVICVLSNMNVPLGNNIGNSLEVEEAMSILKNEKNGKLRDLCIELSSYMVSLGLSISYDKAKDMVISNLENGKAYSKFLEFVKAQGGDIEKLPKAKYMYEVKALEEGYINNIDALKLGIFSMRLGAGRLEITDSIDYSAGIVINKGINDYVKKGDVLVTLYSDKEIEPVDVIDGIVIGNDKVIEEDIIYEVMK